MPIKFFRDLPPARVGEIGTEKEALSRTAGSNKAPVGVYNAGHLHTRPDGPWKARHSGCSGRARD